MTQYTITRAGDAAAAAMDIAIFHPRSVPDHRPLTRLTLQYDDQALIGMFHVADRYVRSVTTAYNGQVCHDSCVEVFLRPRPDLPQGHAQAGYVNFEFNCGGTLHTSYITDPRRTPTGYTAWERLPAELGQKVEIQTSAPPVVEPEITEPYEWTLRFRIPFAVFEPYVGPLGDVAGQVWAGNAYKCADRTSHPHWASWQPQGPELNFHDPSRFGRLVFAP